MPSMFRVLCLELSYFKKFPKCLKTLPHTHYCIISPSFCPCPATCYLQRSPYLTPCHFLWVSASVERAPPQNEVEIKPIPCQYQAAGQGGGNRLLLGTTGNDTLGLLATGRASFSLHKNTVLLS